jgi:hypothetical protein
MVSIGAPTLINVEPVIPADPDAPPYFRVSYYVTNQENEFIGYNLYISKFLLSSEAIITGRAGAPYLPDGLDPTFRHTKDEASTLSTNLKTQSVPYFRPPPAPEHFQYCRTYYFTMRAVLRNGQYSQPGPQLSSCLTDANFCPTINQCN